MHLLSGLKETSENTRTAVVHSPQMLEGDIYAAVCAGVEAVGKLQV